MPTPLSAPATLDAYFLEARCKLLDLAAILDRLDRGHGDISRDPRLIRIQSALSELTGDRPGRAERIQMIFSLEYDPTWSKPDPK